MDCDKYTKEELVELAATDWGFSREDAEKFKLEVLRKACKSPQGGFVYLMALLETLKAGKITEEDIFE